MIHGDRKGEHINRFAENGKYAALKCKQHRVVDFRQAGRKGKTADKYICVSIAQDYQSAKVYLPDESSHDIKYGYHPVSLHLPCVLSFYGG
jgi:hypothetical protein